MDQGSNLDAFEESEMTLKAFVIEGQFKDVFDIARIAKSLGEQYFRTKQSVEGAKKDVRVVRVLGPDVEYKCYIALVEATERKSESVVGFNRSE